MGHHVIFSILYKYKIEIRNSETYLPEVSVSSIMAGCQIMSCNSLNFIYIYIYIFKIEIRNTEMYLLEVSVSSTMVTQQWQTSLQSMIKESPILAFLST